MQRLAVVINLLGVMVVMLALTMLLPLGVSLYLADGAESAYDAAIVVTLVAGGVAWLATRAAKRELQARDGFLLVTLAWTVLPGFATLPLLSYLPRLSFTDAYFEAMAGLTTTGATALVGLDQLPPSINLWRCLLQWLGGLGILVLVVGILPLLGVGGRQALRAETPGPMKDTKLTPRITETAKGLWFVYGVFTVACVLALRWAGMSWLDAVMHAFTTISTGGFSSYDASFSHWNSPAIEAVTIVFMMIAGINFATHFQVLRKRSTAPYFLDAEARVFIAVIVVSIFGVALFLYAKGVYADFATALRFTAFNLVSVATSTGYSNTNFGAWPLFAPLWMLFLASFASCSGSTGGGIKMLRAILMFKQAFRELARIVHPRGYIPIKLAGQVIENNIIFAVLAFMLVYGSAIIAITMLLAATGLDLATAFSAVVACINNLGPGLGQVGPSASYAGLSDFQAWLLVCAMLLGRLELLTVLVLFTPAFWRK
ncbi:MAG TPA: potassium transporter TrkG [Burkholderiales bacterium]|nr:potassium transporter TrkG [Burkholderiales bacterium]